MIDTGLGVVNIKEVVNAITEFPIMVVVTHVHWDHILCDDIAIDNPAIRLFLNNGFIEAYRTEEYIMLKKLLRCE